MANVWVGFGTNLGDLKKNRDEAKKGLHALGFYQNFKESPSYLSEPVYKNGPKPTGEKSAEEVLKSPHHFLNAVFYFETTAAPLEVLDALETIETQMGRTSGKGLWQPRVVDLDLLFYDDLIYHSPKLTVPHPQIPFRRFVLKPLCDLSASWIHPEAGLSLEQILNQCQDPLKVWPYPV